MTAHMTKIQETPNKLSFCMAWSSRGQKESLHTLHRVRLYSQTQEPREREKYTSKQRARGNLINFSERRTKCGHRMRLSIGLTCTSSRCCVSKQVHVVSESRRYRYMRWLASGLIIIRSEQQWMFNVHCSFLSLLLF